MNPTCLICGEAGERRCFEAAEMMFGTREAFGYSECAACGSLQIDAAPEDLAKHYSGPYYSFRKLKAGAFRRRLQAFRDGAQLGAGGLLASTVGRAVARVKSDPGMDVLKQVGLRPSQRILDVGCGAGALVDRLTRAGFRHASGVDPFLEESRRTPAGAAVLKATLSSVEDRQDLVMFNHSLEHVLDLQAELGHAAGLLQQGGICVVRIPTPSSAIWRRYRADWVQLDAPRHIALPSRSGMARLAKRAGFDLARSIDDANVFSLWGSELYRRGRSLITRNGAAVSPTEVFSEREMAKWRAEIAALNASGDADQTAFVLTRR